MHKGSVILRSEAQKRADKKYDKAHYKTIGYKCKLSDINKIKQYAQSQNINSNSMLLHKCLMYCIDNNIKL